MPLLVVKTSIILPGVQTTISAPLFNSDSYPAIPAPPTQQTTFNLRAFVNDLQFEYIWWASSLVGAIIIAIGPSPSFNEG